MRILYCIYQLFIALPLFLVATILTAAFTTIGCILGNGHIWGYYPGMIWSKVTVALFLLPVKVKGKENLQKGQSYVFVANHQGMFDIFLIYGFIHRNFKWMMKYQLRKMPFVGIACKYSHQIFVDKRGPSKIKASYDKARETLRGGMSPTFISFISLFLIHYRMLQIRFTIFNAVILVAFQCWLAYAFFTRPAGTRFPITAVFPIVCAILSFLAVHDIATDEATVRTVDAIKKMKKNRKKSSYFFVQSSPITLYAS